MSLQSELASKFVSVYPACTIKKVDQDNFLDIHLPDVNSKKGTHLYFNTSRGKIKLGFYCRDAAFAQIAADKSDVLEHYSQGIRLAGNPAFDETDEAIAAAILLIDAITNKSTQKESVEKTTGSSKARAKAKQADTSSKREKKPTPQKKKANSGTRRAQKEKKQSSSVKKAASKTTPKKSTTSEKKAPPVPGSINANNVLLWIIILIGAIIIGGLFFS